ncbi:MAG: copper-binding protein [Alphaproteobacteria bacterium]|nr:copper-binding protein [Alphaproteobacteria bacterium]
MKNLLLTTALILAATPAFAKEYTIKEVTDANSGKVYFSPDKLTVQPGDTVTFENAQDDMHNVMFVNQPKQVDEMIMSPMMEKKGDKFSYTFTVPGTYQFHCHPHESLGMKGTIIVGQASKPGETKSMDHHKLKQKLEEGESAAGKNISADSAAPQGTGKIISVDTGKRTIKMKHDPIKALGWPTMTMSFTADSSVDLSSYKEGDAVSFTLKAVGKDDYTIASMKKN